MKKQKSTALLFSSLITGIYEFPKVKIIVSGVRIKNKRALIARIFERIAREFIAAATPEYLAVAKPRQASEIEKILQELSEIINACVKAQREEN